LSKFNSQNIIVITK